jgi:hypothetical protein
MNAPIDIIWLCLDPTAIARGYWDQAFLEDLFAADIWQPPNSHTFTHHEHLGPLDQLPDLDGAIVIIPARYHVEHVAELNHLLGALKWVLLILTSDEESLFPWWEIEHQRLRRWVMTPTPQAATQHRSRTGRGASTRFLGEGWQPGTRQIVRELPIEHDRVDTAYFSGQVTHARRRELARVMNELRAPCNATPGFTQGLDQRSYLSNLVRYRFAPAPSGPATPDSFRAYEALEAGCDVIVEERTGNGKHLSRFWETLYPGHPLHVVDDWAGLGSIIQEDDDSHRRVVSAWWQREKRSIVTRLHADVSELRAMAALPAAKPETVDELVTVIMPTSPSPQHPSTAIIEETIESVRERLPRAELLVLCDGVRPQQEHLRGAYSDYLDQLVDLCGRRWSNVLPILHGSHLHQGLMARRAMREFRTPLVLFVEHDTPLTGEIPFDDLAKPLLGGKLDLLRLHHEAGILEPHRPLMLDVEPVDMLGVPVIRTAQWSQRPHLARYSFYRNVLTEFFGVKSRTMIEDVMHGVTDQAWREHGEDGWRKYRLGIYAPDGDMKRSTHLDGRRGPDGELAPKFDDLFVYAYDGPTPEGAPHPS